MKIIGEYREEMVLLETYLRQQVRPGEVLQILEAGCGREWYFRMEGILYELTGVDLDAAALDARRQYRQDLSHSIVADLRTATLKPNSYDIIYHAFVLEHVQGAAQVLDNFVKWLRPGGILIVRVPTATAYMVFSRGSLRTGLIFCIIGGRGNSKMLESPVSLPTRLSTTKLFLLQGFATFVSNRD